MAGKENKRELILQALERLLPGRRFHEITLDEVAREARVGKGTIYLYFKDKDALFAEMTFSRAEALCRALQALSERNFSGPEALLDRIAGLLDDFLTRHRSWFGARTALAAHVMRMSQEYEERGRALREELLTTLAALLARGISCPAAESRHLAQILLWLVFGRNHAESCREEHIPEWTAVREFFRRGAGLC